MVGSRHLADTLLSLNVNVRAFFAPEHGIRGGAAAGEIIKDGKDPVTGLPVVSLYGKKKMPDGADLAEIDVVLFDLQDVGARPFTYVSTLSYLMEACAVHRKSIMVLDRPNPLGGELVSGWILEDSLRSFVGRFPVPMIHGLTIGEFAQMIKGERWIPGADSLHLVIIPTENWKRSMTWRQTGRPWVAPSPNLSDLDAVFLYPGTVLFEGTTISEGRGTLAPFCTIAAPDLKFPLKSLNGMAAVYNIRIRSSSVTPVSIPGKAVQPKFEGKKCPALVLEIVDSGKAVDGFSFGLQLVKTLLRENPIQRTTPFLRKLAGSGRIDAFLATGPSEKIVWKDELSTYIKQRTPYLLYE